MVLDLLPTLERYSLFLGWRGGGSFFLSFLFFPSLSFIFLSSYFFFFFCFFCLEIRTNLKG